MKGQLRFDPARLCKSIAPWSSRGIDTRLARCTGSAIVSTVTSPELDLRARVRALPAPACGLADLAEKYELLIALGRGEPGRTLERRDDMRRIAARFPGALREWEERGLEELETRQAEVARLCDVLLADPLASDQHLARAADWVRYALHLHPLLVEILAVKRWIAAQVGGVCRGMTPELSAAFAVWYGRRRAQVPGAELWAAWFTPAHLDRVAQPPAGQVTRLAYAAVAEHFGVPVTEVKQVLFGVPGRPPV